MRLTFWNFQEAGLSLIHIPLHLYPYFLQPILQLLFLSDDDEDQAAHGHSREPWASTHRFLNISVTPLECSVVCSRQHARELFLPHLHALGSLGEEVSISVDDYMVIQVDGDGLDAGRRVVELIKGVSHSRKRPHALAHLDAVQVQCLAARLQLDR